MADGNQSGETPLAVELPDSVSLNRPERITLKFRADIRSAKVRIRCDARRLLVTGPGKRKNDLFEYHFADRGVSRTVELELAIVGELQTEVVVPVEVFVAADGKKSDVFVAGKPVTVRPSTAAGLGLKIDHAAAFLKKLKELGTTAAIAIPTIIIAVATFGVIIPALYDYSLVALQIRQYRETDWGYAVPAPLDASWDHHNQWRITDPGIPGGPPQAVFIAGEVPAIIRGIADAKLHDFTVEMKIWNPIGIGWVVRSQTDPHLGYRFWIEKSPSGPPQIAGETLAAGLFASQPASESLGEPLALNLRECCSASDALTLRITVDDSQISYDLKRSNPHPKDGIPVGFWINRGPFTISHQHYHRGNFGLFLKDSQAHPLLESFRIVPKPRPSLVDTMMGQLNVLKAFK